MFHPISNSGVYSDRTALIPYDPSLDCMAFVQGEVEKVAKKLCKIVLRQALGLLHNNREMTSSFQKKDADERHRLTRNGLNEKVIHNGFTHFEKHFFFTDNPGFLDSRLDPSSEAAYFYLSPQRSFHKKFIK